MDKERRVGQRRYDSRKVHHHHRHNEHRAHKDRHRKYREVLKRNDKKSYTPTRDNTPRPSPERLKEFALSGDKDYVLRWLAGTEGEVAIQTCTDDHAQLPAIASREAKLSRVHGQITHPEQHGERIGNATRKIAKIHYNTSSDSSILEVLALPISRAVHANIEKEEKERSSKSKHESTRTKKKQKSGSIGSTASHVSEIVVPPKETFDKRARHKTRDDRYEPKAKRQKVGKADEKGKEKKSGRRKKEGRKAKRDSEEVMRNFTSKNLGQERLTIRAPFTLGLFQNGRSSDAAKNNGVPDLAFSEMFSLQNDERQRPTLEMEQKLARTREKERKKEKSRLAKAQEGVSSFFRQFRKPLQELDMNQVSEVMNYSTQKPTNFPAQNQTSSLYSQQRDTSSHDFALPSHRIDQVDTGRVSGRKTSYISWSETQFSPRSQAKQVNGREVAQCCTSPIPKSILDSLRRTGVYIDTGIQTQQSTQESCVRMSHGRLSSHRRLAPETNDLREHNNGIGIRPQHEATTSTTESSHQIASSPPQRRSPSDVKVRRNLIKKARDRRGKDRQVSHSAVASDAPCNRRRKPGEVIIEHFDRDLGWHQKSTTRSQTTKPLEPSLHSIVSESPLKDRKQLVRKARTKRPATAAPILHVQESVPRVTAKGDSLGAEHIIRPWTAPLEASVQTESLAEVSSKPTSPSYTSAKRQLAGDKYSEYKILPRVAQEQDAIFKHNDDHNDPGGLKSVHCKTSEFTLPMTGFRASSSLYNQGLMPAVNGPFILDLPMRGGLSNRINIATSMPALPASEPLFSKQMHQGAKVGNAYGGAQDGNMRDPRMDMMSPESMEVPKFGDCQHDWNHLSEDVDTTQYVQYLEPSDHHSHQYMLDVDEMQGGEPRDDAWQVGNQLLESPQQYEVFEEQGNLDQYDTNLYDRYCQGINASIEPMGGMFYQENRYNDVSYQPPREEFQEWRFGRQF